MVWTTHNEFEAQREGHKIHKMLSLLFSLFLNDFGENFVYNQPNGVGTDLWFFATP